jgi:putative transposase
MPQVEASKIVLTNRVIDLLNSIIRKQNSSQCIVKRARIILLAAQGIGNKPISRELGVDRRVVRHWRNKWYNSSETISEAESKHLNDKDFTQLILDILSDEQRSGAPATFTAEQILKIVAIACETPADSDREVSHWTPREIAEEAIKRNIVETISTRSVERFLKSGRNQTSSK